jgi:predicted SAM-dependent methyltransferase
MQRRLSLSLQPIRRRVGRSWRVRDLVLSVGRNNQFVAREDLARRYLAGEGIEIGAGSLPLRVPPRARVRYVDNADREALIAKAGGDFLGPDVDAAAELAPVDVVDDARTLATFPDESVDFVIANHVLEHLEDPIGALENWARATRPKGIVFLTLPDARYSFDYLRERTTVEHLVRDHAEGPQTSRDRHYAEWAEFIEGIGPEGIPARSAEYAAADAHHHFHVWELDTFLGLLAAIDLNCELLHAQLSQKEFAVILRKR